MNIFDLLKRLKSAMKPPIAKERQPMKISHALLASMPTGDSRLPIKPYEPPPGIVPDSKLSAAMAMDATPYDYLNTVGFSGAFPGYPYLADLSQRPEYRKITGIIADEMVRKWIELKTVGDDDKSDKIEALNAALERYKVRQAFKIAAEHDGYFGRGQVYLDVNMPSGTLATDNHSELETPLFLDPAKVKKGSLVGLRNIEPVWTYPGLYQSTDPLRPDYYKPSQWFVMGKTVHASRVLMFISRPVPDMLKAAYNFGGLSLSQIAEPYVNNWLRTRNSVGDLVHSFSLTILKTNMAAALSGAADPSLFLRADLFNQTRDNRGLMMIDKDQEEIAQINTPLSGVHELQAQAQEQMASVSSIPLVKLLGITPSGLNASSDGEIRVFYDFIKSQQESIFRDPLKKVIDVIQLSEFGEIDPDITFEFVPLYQLSEAEIATVRKADADTDAVYVQNGILAPEEVRQKLASDPDSPYHGLDLSDEVDVEEQEPEDAEADKA